MTSSERRAWPLLVAAALVLSAPCFAQTGAPPSAADLESARSLFKQGKDLRAKGDLEAALEKFKAAHTYGQTPITGLELGRTQFQLKHYIDAREVLLSVGRMKLAPDETDNSAKARAEAKELAAQIQPLVAGIEVHVGNAPSTKVTVDGADVPVLSGVVDRAVDPGTHRVVARIEGGEESTADVVLGDGEHETLELMPKAPVVTAPPVVAAPPRLVAKPPPPKGTLSPLVYVGFGLAGAGAIVGGITGAFALSDAGSANDLCGAHGKRACATSAAASAAEAKRTEGETVATVSTISFIVAGVGAAVGITGLILPRSKPKSTSASIAPVLGLGYAGLGGRF